MKVKDIKTGKIETVIERTSNSFRVTRTKLTKEGVNCTNWFTQQEFEKSFKIIEE